MLVRDVTLAAVTAVTTWIASVQKERNKFGLTLWDGTASSIFVHPSPHPQPSPPDNSCKELPQPKHVDFLGQDLETTLAVEIGVVVILMIIIVLHAKSKYGRPVPLEASSSSSVRRRTTIDNGGPFLGAREVPNSEENLASLWEVISLKNQEITHLEERLKRLDEQEQLQVNLIDQQKEELENLKQQLNCEVNKFTELENKIEESNALHSRLEDELTVLRRNGDVKQGVAVANKLRLEGEVADLRRQLDSGDAKIKTLLARIQAKDTLLDSYPQSGSGSRRSSMLSPVNGVGDAETHSDANEAGSPSHDDTNSTASTATKTQKITEKEDPVMALTTAKNDEKDKESPIALSNSFSLLDTF